MLNSPWLRVLETDYQLPSGEPVGPYYTVERDDFVVVVARIGTRVVLVRQYRPATERHYWALPAGYIDATESPEDAAIRELREETGLRAAGVAVVSTLDPLPGYIRSRCHIVEANCELNDAVEMDSEVEEIMLVEYEDAIGMVLAGQIDEMQAVAALSIVRLRGLMSV